VDFAFSLSGADVVHPYTVRGEDLGTYSAKLDKQSDAELCATHNYTLPARRVALGLSQRTCGFVHRARSWAATKGYLSRHSKVKKKNPNPGLAKQMQVRHRRVASSICQGGGFSCTRRLCALLRALSRRCST
jgi:hypothetical protein